VHAVQWIGARTRGKQAARERVVPAVAGSHQRRHAFERRQIHVRSCTEHALRQHHVALFRGEEQGGLAEAIARVGRGTLGQHALDLRHVRLARADEQLGIQVRVGRRLRTGRTGTQGKHQSKSVCPEREALVTGGRGHRVDGRCPGGCAAVGIPRCVLEKISRYAQEEAPRRSPLRRAAFNATFRTITRQET
jgi:hypothetical protein